MNELIDPEELPFTRDEIHRAARLFYPDDVAARMADHLRDCGPGLVEHRAKRRAEWRKSGVADADTMRLGGWAYPEELLPALAALSVDSARRAQELNAHTWAGLHRSVIYQEQRAIAQAAGQIPTLESLMAADRAERKREGKRPRKLSGIVVASAEGEWPAETEAMRKLADQRVAEAQAKWREDVRRFEVQVDALARGAV